MFIAFEELHGDFLMKLSKPLMGFPDFLLNPDVNERLAGAFLDRLHHDLINHPVERFSGRKGCLGSGEVKEATWFVTLLC